MAADDQDVIIVGGGLAGLTLALQLRRELPDAAITVLEKLRHPVPPAIHKIGESSVEIAAHYFDTVLGLKDHLLGEQLKKFGFRFFFSKSTSCGAPSRPTPRRRTEQPSTKRMPCSSAWRPRKFSNRPRSIW